MNTTVSSGDRETDPTSRVATERVVYVAPDCTDSAVWKRAHGFLRLGHHVTSFSFRRHRYNVGAVPDWPNVELGQSEERQLRARLIGLSHAVQSIYRYRQTWRDATVLYCRNLDLAVLTLMGKWMTRSRAPVVFEVLDIHPLLPTRGLKSTVLRWLERRVLNRCRLLVVSSPAFLREYYGPWQGYVGRSFLMENKWPDPGVFLGQRRLEYVSPAGPTSPRRWTIGWFGNLRCPASLRILLGLADALPDDVLIYLRGCPSLLGEGALQAAIADRKNVVFAGEYLAPQELPAIYSHVHFNWCGDFSDGANSQWLLPNRIYEGGYFGIPALAVERHETGRYVQENGLGVTLAAPYLDSLVGYFRSLTIDQYHSLRTAIEAKPLEMFVDDHDLASLLTSLRS